jgi:hypothetical protein
MFYKSLTPAEHFATAVVHHVPERNAEALVKQQEAFPKIIR